MCWASSFSVMWCDAEGCGPSEQESMTSDSFRQLCRLAGGIACCACPSTALHTRLLKALGCTEGRREEGGRTAAYPPTKTTSQDCHSLVLPPVLPLRGPLRLLRCWCGYAHSAQVAAVGSATPSSSTACVAAPKCVQSSRVPIRPAWSSAAVHGHTA